MKTRKIRIIAVLAAVAAWAALSCEDAVEPPGPVPWDYYDVKGLTDRYEIADVYMLSATEGWAVTCGGYILRFDGTEWRVHTDFSEEYEGLDITRLSFCAPDEGWALGRRYERATGQYECFIFRFDGTSWTRVTAIHEGLKYCEREYDVAALAPDDVWIANLRGIFRYDGRTWEAYLVGERNSLSFSSPSNGWAAGYGPIYKWNGSEWQLTLGEYVSAYEIACPSDDSAWVVGGFRGSCEIPAQYEISRWNEEKGLWEIYDEGRFKDPYFVLYRMHFASPTDGWAVSPHIVVRYDGREWRETAMPPLCAASVFTLGGDEVWVGSYGCMYKYDPGTVD